MKKISNIKYTMYCTKAKFFHKLDEKVEFVDYGKIDRFHNSVFNILNDFWIKHNIKL